jgi:CRP/FNR family transcriptional regulator, dissimilatory nitrate respiration regulator
MSAMTFVTEPTFRMERQAALHRVLFLKTLPDAAIETLARMGRERRLQRGETLFLENSRCLGLLVVLSGAIKVYKLDNRGRELTLDLEQPGESVAEHVLFDGSNYPANAEAIEDDTTVLLVPRESFREVMALYPEIAEQGLKALSVRMRKLTWMLETQTLHTVRARLAHYLLRVSDGRTTFALEDTNEEIGSQIGTVREVVSRTMHSLKDAGAIEIHARQVTLRSPDTLCRIAESATE